MTPRSSRFGGPPPPPRHKAASRAPSAISRRWPRTWPRCRSWAPRLVCLGGCPGQCCWDVPEPAQPRNAARICQHTHTEASGTTPPRSVLRCQGAWNDFGPNRCSTSAISAKLCPCVAHVRTILAPCGPLPQMSGSTDVGQHWPNFGLMWPGQHRPRIAPNSSTAPFRWRVLGHISQVPVGRCRHVHMSDTC